MDLDERSSFLWRDMNVSLRVHIHKSSWPSQPPIQFVSDLMPGSKEAGDLI
jgi:hypothetical protein